MGLQLLFSQPDFNPKLLRRTINSLTPEIPFHSLIGILCSLLSTGIQRRALKVQFMYTALILPIIFYICFVFVNVFLVNLALELKTLCSSLIVMFLCTYQRMELKPSDEFKTHLTLKDLTAKPSSATTITTA